jgi:hypothetical protein
MCSVCVVYVWRMCGVVLCYVSHLPLRFCMQRSTTINVTECCRSNQLSLHLLLVQWQISLVQVTWHCKEIRNKKGKNENKRKRKIRKKQTEKAKEKSEKKSSISLYENSMQRSARAV